MSELDFNVSHRPKLLWTVDVIFERVNHALFLAE